MVPSSSHWSPLGVTLDSGRPCPTPGLCGAPRGLGPKCSSLTDSLGPDENFRSRSKFPLSYCARTTSSYTPGPAILGHLFLTLLGPFVLGHHLLPPGASSPRTWEVSLSSGSQVWAGGSSQATQRATTLSKVRGCQGSSGKWAGGLGAQADGGVSFASSGEQVTPRASQVFLPIIFPHCLPLC